MNSKYVKPAGGIPASDLDEDSQNNLGNVNKSIYNLGAYDTFVDNGDGTATITRKTGYTVLDGSDDEKWEFGESVFIWINWSIDIGAVRNVDRSLPGLKANFPTYPWGQLQTLNEGISHYYHLRVKIASIEASSNNLEAFKQYLSQHPIYIQYETETSYTETVIDNQPFATFDQNGEQWLRSEWAKTVNLNPYKKSGSGVGFNWTYDDNDQSLTFNGVQTKDNRWLIILVPPNTLPAGVYTFIVRVLSGTYTLGDGSTNGVLRIGCDWNAINGAYSLIELGAPGIYRIVLNTTNESSFMIMNALYGGSGNTLTDYKIQIALYEGNVNYPFYPYNGHVVHEEYLETATVNNANNLGGVAAGQYALKTDIPESLDGTTFTPNVDGEGNLSWTNNGGLPNPEPVNLKGQDGAGIYTAQVKQENPLQFIVYRGSGQPEPKVGDAFICDDSYGAYGGHVYTIASIVSNEGSSYYTVTGNYANIDLTGDTGATPTISATASVSDTTGTPSVSVTKSGTDENPSFAFAFSGLKGEPGEVALYQHIITFSFKPNTYNGNVFAVIYNNTETRFNLTSLTNFINNLESPYPISGYFHDALLPNPPDWLAIYLMKNEDNTNTFRFYYFSASISKATFFTSTDEIKSISDNVSRIL